MPDVGADIESICRKCGDVWHVVVAKVGDQIVKVQCKQCGGNHRYKPPGGAAASPRPSRRAARTPSSKPKGVPASRKPLVQADASKPMRPYRITETFVVGDRVMHKSFGEGVVELVVGPRKVQVFFASGRRILAHDH